MDDCIDPEATYGIGVSPRCPVESLRGVVQDLVQCAVVVLVVFLGFVNQ